MDEIELFEIILNTINARLIKEEKNYDTVRSSRIRYNYLYDIRIELINRILKEL